MLEWRAHPEARLIELYIPPYTGERKPTSPGTAGAELTGQSSSASEINTKNGKIIYTHNYKN